MDRRLLHKDAAPTDMVEPRTGSGETWICTVSRGHLPSGARCRESAVSPAPRTDEWSAMSGTRRPAPAVCGKTWQRRAIPAVVGALTALAALAPSTAWAAAVG